MMKIFISYAREDFKSAERLYRLISIRNTKCWIDTKGLKPGQVWEEVIVRIINRADVFVALISRSAMVKQGFMQKEVDLALKRLQKEEKLYIIPVRLENIDLAHTRMANLESIDLFPDWNFGVEKIKTRINMLLGPQEKVGGIDLDPEELQLGHPSNIELLFDNEAKN